MGGCTRISIHLRPDIRCSEVGKTRSRDLRLVNGKAGEEAYHSGPGVAYGSGGVSLRRDKAACWLVYATALTRIDLSSHPDYCIGASGHAAAQ
jgi:hypothetical protein